MPLEYIDGEWLVLSHMRGRGKEGGRKEAAVLTRAVGSWRKETMAGKRNKAVRPCRLCLGSKIAIRPGDNYEESGGDE